MFERFTSQTRRIVVDAQVLARAAGAAEISEEHLLIALVERDGEGARLLRRAGLGSTAPALRARLDDVRRRAGVSSQDAEALRQLGIDVEC